MTDVIHEGNRVFAQGKGLGRTLLELYFYFAIAGLLLAWLRDASPVLVVVIAGGSATAFAIALALLSRGRVQVTPTEVRVRRVVRTTSIPQGRIAEVVVIRNFRMMGGFEGYLALLDQSGSPLWRSATNSWPPETIDALMAVGHRVSEEPELGPQEIRTRWPRLLPWSLAHPQLAFWWTILGCLAALGLLLVMLIVLLT